MRRWVVAGAVMFAVAGVPSVARARSVQDERYPVEQTWNATIRLLRVDMGFEITERDRETGFVLFTYRDAGRSSPGSVEIIPSQVDGVAGCRIVVHLAQMPAYAERHLLARLARKLRDEYGEPPAPVRRPPAAPPANPPESPAAPPEGSAPSRPEQPAG
jgi:hypothetical protein